MNNLVDIFLPIKGDRQPFQPGQPHQPTQAELEKMKRRKRGDGFGPLPPPQPPPPPVEVGRAWGGRAVMLILVIIIGIISP